jgi:transcriptional regulator with XRE-family HTH domain
MTNFGKNIKKIRSIQKLSQTKFAELFDLSRASIGAYEEGRAEARLEVISKIANYFSITMDDLINKEITVNKLYHFNIFDDNITNKINIGTEVLKNTEFTNIPLVISHDLINQKIEQLIEKTVNHITLPSYTDKHLAILIEKDAYDHLPEYFKNNDIIIVHIKGINEEETSLNSQNWLIKSSKSLSIGEIKRIKKGEILFFPEDGSPFSIPTNNIDYILPLETIISHNPAIPHISSSRLQKIESQVNDLYNRL